MTRDEQKKQHRITLCEKCRILEVMIEEWTEFIEKTKYNAKNTAYLRDLKKRRHIIEVRIKNFSI